MNRRELAAGMRKIAKSSRLLKKTSLSILLLNLYSSFKNYDIIVEVHLKTFYYFEVINLDEIMVKMLSNYPKHNH